MTPTRLKHKIWGFIYYDILKNKEWCHPNKAWKILQYIMYPLRTMYANNAKVRADYFNWTYVIEGMTLSIPACENMRDWEYRCVIEDWDIAITNLHTNQSSI